MKLFETIQKNMAAMGFTQNPHQTNFYQNLTTQHVCVITLILIDVFLHGVPFFYVVNDIDEYIDLIFELTVEIGILVVYFSIIFKYDDLCDVVERCATEMTESKS